LGNVCVEVRMLKSSLKLLFLSVFLWIFSSQAVVLADTYDWYAYYVQCVATSSQESVCYQAIQDYLMTEEGQQQAKEIGFKRRLASSSDQIPSQVIVISNRITQMDRYLSSMLEKARGGRDEEQNVVMSFCLQEKKALIASLNKVIEEKKNTLLNLAAQSPLNDKIESEYQLFLSINGRANEIYQQARECIK